MNVVKILFLLFCLGLAPAYADSRIGGNVLDENGDAVINFTISVNGAKTIRGQDGAYTAGVKDGEIFTLQVSAKGYYSARHTFATKELSGKYSGKDTGELRIPAIGLVAKKEGRVMLAFGGDVMMARRYKNPRAGEQALIRNNHKLDDSRAIVKFVKPYFDLADFGSVNLETQVMAAKPKGSASKSITFFSPPETVDALAWAGVDYVTLGNNHTYDNLKEGLVSTLDILAKSPLGFSGAGLNEAAALKAHRTSLSGVPYSFLGYVGWQGSSRPHQAAEGADKGGAALGSMSNMVRTVDREVAAGQTTVVQYHGSLEYKEEPSLVTEQRLKSAIDRGADIAIAHHPHVVQGFEIYKNRLIAYSLGNFIFDQYYYGPQFSYMLYVWMDGEIFHRAEIVPLYIKGYKPTPAVGPVRHAVLKRVASLSARRNLVLSQSGGHAVITAKTPEMPQHTKQNIRLKYEGDQILDVSHCDAMTSVTGLWSESGNIQYRLGQELLRRGDFDHYNSFDAPERGWIPQNEGSGPVVHAGQKALKVMANADEDKSIFGMKVFTRIYKPGNPMTFSGTIYGDKAAEVDVYLQVRPSRWGLQKSLDGGPKQHLGHLTVEKGQWQDFAVDFNTPRVGVHSFRILVMASGADGGPVAPLYYDDVALIEWQTAYGDSNADQKISSPNRITHMGIRAGSRSDKLTLSLSGPADTDNNCYTE